MSDFCADTGLFLRDDSEVAHQETEKAAHGGDGRYRQEHHQKRELRPAAFRGGGHEASIGRWREQNVRKYRDYHHNQDENRQTDPEIRFALRHGRHCTKVRGT